MLSEAKHLVEKKWLRVLKIFWFALIWSCSLSSLAVAKNQPNAVITIAWDAIPRSFDPRYAVDANSQYLIDLTHCSLITFDQNGATTGDLAKHWQWENPTTLNIEIKTDAKFSSGDAVTAEDIKATYDYFKTENLKNPSPLAGAFKKIKQIDVKNANTLVIKLSEPESSFVQNLFIGILPKKLASAEMLQNTSDIVGCGPYIIAEKNVNDLVLKENRHYALNKQPTVKTIIIKIVKDELTRFAKLQKGEVDFIQNGISRDKVVEVASKYPQLKVEKRPGLNVTYLGFNMRDEILKQTKVRQAIARAVNVDQIIEYILKGFAIPAATILTPGDPFYNKNVKRIPYDPESAKKLLDEAGFSDPDGKGPKPRFELTYKTTTEVTRINIAKAIASNLERVGIKVSVLPLEWGRFKSDVEKGLVQMWSLSWVGFKDPDIYRFAFATENAPPNGGNRGWYSNKQLDELLQQASITTDLKKRKELYMTVQDIVSKELPYVFLWHEETIAVFHKSIKGYRVYADGRLTSLRNIDRVQ